jgi:hypothetical protein
MGTKKKSVRSKKRSSRRRRPRPVAALDEAAGSVTVQRSDVGAAVQAAISMEEASVVTSTAVNALRERYVVAWK